MQRLSHFVTLLGVVFLLGLSGFQAHAQVQAETERSTGLPSSYVHSANIDSVDATSGNLRITIPLLNMGGRGLDTQLVLSYNSKTWRTEQTPVGSEEMQRSGKKMGVVSKI